MIHSKSPTHPTSSIRFEDQDIVAVSLFLRTGNILDFAYAASVSNAVDKKLGLPPSKNYPEHANQNPNCTELDGEPWFPSIDELIDAMRDRGLL